MNEKMKLTVCVSPEAGWSELEAFLAATEERLTVAMYQFTGAQIFEAVRAAVTPEGRRLELVLHPIPEKPAKSGVKAHDLDEEEKVIAPARKEDGRSFPDVVGHAGLEAAPRRPMGFRLSHQGRRARRQDFLALER